MGHKGVVAKMFQEVDNTLVTAPPYTPTVLDKIAQLKRSLLEKVDTIN